MTIGALAGTQVASAPQLATAPVAALFLGTVVGTIPAARFMARAGRKPGFVLGALLGAAGGLVAAWGVYSQSLFLLSLGTFLVGGYQAFAQFYRFAASEVADVSFQPRAISLVIAGGVVAAVLGPGLASVGGPLLEPAYIGSFLILSIVCLMATGVLAYFRMPAPSIAENQGEARPLLAIVRQPAYAIALFAAATGSGVMVLAMTATPLAMGHHQHGLSDTTFVIQGARPRDVPAVVLHRVADCAIWRAADHAGRGDVAWWPCLVESDRDHAELLWFRTGVARARLELPLRWRHDIAD